MRDAIHGEGVEPDFFFHDRKALIEKPGLISPGRAARLAPYSPSKRRAVGEMWCMKLPIGKPNVGAVSISGRRLVLTASAVFHGLICPTARVSCDIFSAIVPARRPGRWRGYLNAASVARMSEAISGSSLNALLGAKDSCNSSGAARLKVL
jgi:hypothetical protein